jgi:hypothetical protein
MVALFDLLAVLVSELSLRNADAPPTVIFAH